MKTPVVDYRKLRLKNMTSPEYNHLLLLLGWAIYFSLYFLTEWLIPWEDCTPVRCWLDDVIPFCEWFFIPYTFWYVLIVVSLGYFALYDIPSFRGLSKFIFTTQMVAMAIYILWPNRQDLRPEVFPRDNLLTRGVAFLYAFDTSTNVCPSLHVAYSIGIASAWLKRKESPVWWKCFVVVAVVLICMATAFIKQHSVVDAFAAVPVCMVAEWIGFGWYWKKKFQKNP